MINVLLLMPIVCISMGFGDVNANEYEVKAAFIYNFSKYVEWDSKLLSNSESFKIAIYQKSEIERHLKELTKDKKIQNKKIEIEVVKDVNSIESIQILFIPEQVNLTDFKKIISKLTKKNTLIISEKKGRLEYGSCINFLTVSNKIKFEINLSALKKNNLKASSQLLKLAERIEE